jgi:hypothetical protein
LSIVGPKQNTTEYKTNKYLIHYLEEWNYCNTSKIQQTLATDFNHSKISKPIYLHKNYQNIS